MKDWAHSVLTVYWYFFFITKYNTNVLSRVVIIIEFKGSASPLSVQMKQTNTLCYYVSAIIRV